MAIQSISMPGLGDIFGQSLSTGLQGLAQHKLQEVTARNQQRAQSSALQSLVSPESSPQQKLAAISQLPPELQKVVLQNIDQIIGQPQQEYQQPMQPQQQQMQRGIQGGPAAGLTATPFGGNPISSLMGAQGQTQNPVQQQQQMQPQEQQQFQQTLSKKQNNLFKSPQQRIAEENAFLKRENLLEKKIARGDKNKLAAFNATREDRRNIYNEARSAKNNLEDLNRMEELDKTGNLDSPGWDAFLQRSNLDIAALRSPESEEFGKIAQSYLKDARQYFGGKVSNYEVEQFLKTIPSLSQSPEGRKRVISNLKRFNRMKIAYKEAMTEAIKSNGGVPPLDLLEQIDERLDNKTAAISKMFKEDLARPVPGAPSKFKTFLGAIAGEAANRLPRAATQAGVGYLAGSRFGGPGGGLIGGGLGFLSGLTGNGLKGLF